jgi:ubiquinone/menaquinone biosynthesis C-methylase UbiE
MSRTDLLLTDLTLRYGAVASLLEELTEDVFRRAGLGPGIQVLDISSGVAEVSLLAAIMVGSDGAVLCSA